MSEVQAKTHEDIVDEAQAWATSLEEIARKVRGSDALTTVLDNSAKVIRALAAVAIRHATMNAKEGAELVAKTFRYCPQCGGRTYGKAHARCWSETA